MTPCRVLVVDDDRDVGDTFALLLEALGAGVRVARGGEQNVAACAEFSPQVVFLHIGMTGMDGYETARRMRELPSGRAALLVALSGWREELTRNRVKGRGLWSASHEAG